MQELVIVGQAQAQALFEGLSEHLAIAGVFAGTAPARLFVDRPSGPRCALLQIGYRYYLAGSPDVDVFNDWLRRFLDETVFPQARAAGAMVFLLYYTPEGWEPRIDAILSGKRPQHLAREYYSVVLDRSVVDDAPRPLPDEPPPADWRAVLPEGFSLRLVDEALLGEKHLMNLDALAEEMCSERPTVADFLARSFGVCLVHGNEIAGWCLSEYNTPERCEVGIATLEPYRRRGLGTLMARALLEEARARGLVEVGWDCFAGNRASGATPRKAGFVKQRDYAVYLAWYGE